MPETKIKRRKKDGTEKKKHRRKIIYLNIHFKTCFNLTKQIIQERKCSQMMRKLDLYFYSFVCVTSVLARCNILLVRLYIYLYVVISQTNRSHTQDFVWKRSIPVHNEDEDWRVMLNSSQEDWVAHWVYTCVPSRRWQ